MFGGILMVFMFLIAVFLILLVLVQRGRGGGLAGALGGMGGQSAFGTKAGDLFTRITIGAATVWILLCVLGVKYFNADETFDSSLGGAAKQTDFSPRPGANPAPVNDPLAPPGGAGAAPAANTGDSAGTETAATQDTSAPTTEPGNDKPVAEPAAATEAPK
jgi:preprotein translocase subunit SecG